MEQSYPVEEVLGGADAQSASLPWTVGANGVAAAKGYDDATAAGGKSLKFVAADEASAWVEAVVTNACRVTFDWKSSCEPLVKGRPYDYLAFAVDGEQQGFICGETGWTSVTNYVTGEGEHVLRWTFMRDEEGSAGEDCTWLANVAVTPSVTLSFASGGATAGSVPEPITAYADESIVLPGQGSLAWPKHSFVGWSNGVNTFTAGTVATSATLPNGGTFVILTAVWAANTLSAPVIMAPETYEADSATVTITADNGATIFYTTDGTEPGAASMLYQGAFTVTGSATIKAIAVKADYFDSAVASATVTRLPWTFGECLNCPERTFTTGDDAAWTRVKGVSADGYALRSGVITHSQTSRLETVVYGAGTVAFRCKVAGEIVKRIVFDGLAFCVDGVQQGDLMGENAWSEKSFAVTGDGRHVLSWLYVKDEDGNGDGEDCAWLDNVTWTPVDPLPALDLAATDSDVQAIIVGLSDVRLSDTVCNTTAYVAFRSWVDGKRLSHALVKDSPNARLSYVLDAPGLMAKAALTSDDVVIESVEPSGTSAGAFDLIVGIGGEEIGEGARLAAALGVEGAAELDESAFSSEGLAVTLERTAGGKAKATVTPAGTPSRFFLRVKVR